MFVEWIYPLTVWDIVRVVVISGIFALIVNGSVKSVNVTSLDLVVKTMSTTTNLRTDLRTWLEINKFFVLCFSFC